MSVDYHIFLALFLALLAPGGLLLTRHELRRVRERVVQDLADTVFADQRSLPQVSLVLARYRKNGDSRQARVQPFAGAVVFVLVGLIGFLLLFTPASSLRQGGLLRPDLADALFWSFPTPAVPPLPLGTSLSDPALQTAAIAGFAFLGGYIFQLSYLIRATLAQELSALSFVRASLRLFVGMIVAVILFRALGLAIGGDANVGTGNAFGAALGGAFVAGYWPELGVSRLARWLKVRLKAIDEDALATVRVIPVEVIDGIDSEIGFRLQENGIYDVQNLATANPIQLYAETPFGIFECFDWVLQAQLCMVVGASTFQILKQHNIRTIFDLERATLAQGAPAAYVQAVGAILFAAPDPRFRTLIGIPADGTSVTVTTETVRHVVAIICDDLHVHRLRALWNTLLLKTAGQNDPHRPWLYETGWLPGEAPDAQSPLPPGNEVLLAEAALIGERYRMAAAIDPQDALLPGMRQDCLTLVSQLAAFGGQARARLRRLWTVDARDKRPGEHSLEAFANDPDFRAMLA